jgi:twinkle protein
MSESRAITKGPCSNAECGSSDACHLYDDGHTHCFSCGETVQQGISHAHRKGKIYAVGTTQDLVLRRINEDTCKKWGYEVGEYGGRPVQIANYRDEKGHVVAQKLRFPDKTFTILGDAKKMNLYGQHLWRDGGKMVVVTEGEIDALTVSQLQSNKWPAVSLPNGAQAAKRSIQRSLEWLEKFETVVLMFDDDEQGRKAVEECAPLLTPGKCKVARIAGYKDANAAHQDGKGSLVIDAMWGAKVYRPDGVISVADVYEQALKPIPTGDPWCFDRMTKWTHGRRPGELYAFGAGTGVGKTDLFTQSIAYDVFVLEKRTGVIYLEQPPVETVRRIAGKTVGKIFHVPGAADPADLAVAMEKLKEANKLFLYDHFGASDWELIKQRIRYMVVSLGCEHVYLDHLTALVAQEEDERKALDSIMSELAGQAQELKHKLHFISHLATPEGKPHEEGGRVMIRHFRGARSIGFWSHFMFGLERNQQAEDELERSVTTLRCLKDRNTGFGTGKTLAMTYDAETGLLHAADEDETFEKDNPKKDF